MQVLSPPAASNTVRLNPEEVRTRPRWTFQPILPAVTMALATLFAAYALFYWGPRHLPHSFRVPWRQDQTWELWLAVALGLLGGLLTARAEWRRGLRPLVLAAILRRRPRVRRNRRLIDWAPAAPLLVLIAIVMIADPTGSRHLPQAWGAYIVATGVGMFALVPFYVRVWRAAWHVVRRVNAARSGRAG
jgi:hypothetical protein